jgi:N-acetylmuramoyl-L-alanine amidase
VASGRSSTKGYEVLYPDEKKSLASKVSDASAARPIASTRYVEKGPTNLTREQDRFLWNIVLEDNRRESKRLAAEIQRSMTSSNVGENRGLVPRKDLYILNRTQAPIVLVEIGFISHPSEEKLISSEAGQEKIARAIADGILNYKNRFEKNGAH